MAGNPMKLTFKEYYNSKKRLLEAIDSSPKIKLQYKLQKYCKVPLLEHIDTDDKTYISFKPDDIIEVVWEYDTPESPTVRCIKLVETNETYFPVWGSIKFFNWTLNNTKEI